LLIGGEGHANLQKVALKDREIRTHINGKFVDIRSVDGSK
jgi:hypothetical protein